MRFNGEGDEPDVRLPRLEKINDQVRGRLPQHVTAQLLVEVGPPSNLQQQPRLEPGYGSDHALTLSSGQRTKANERPQLPCP